MRAAASNVLSIMCYKILILFVFAYIDDIIIFSKNELKHKKHLLEIANRLNSYGLTLNMNKRVLDASQLNVLGYKLNASGITASDEKILQLSKTFLNR